MNVDPVLSMDHVNTYTVYCCSFSESFVFHSSPSSLRIETEFVQLWQGRRLQFMSVQNDRIQNYLNESAQYFSP